MRIGILKSAALAALLSMGTACSHQKAPSQQPKRVERTNAPSTAAAAEPSTEPSNPPTVQPVIQPTTEATAAPAPQPAAEPAPVVQPAAATPPISEPASQPASQPTTQAVAPFSPAPPTTNPAEVESDARMAEWICSIAQVSIPLKIQSNDLWQPTWKRVAALLEAAVKLEPTEPRFSRLLTDAELQLQDVDGALSALAATRKSDPEDQFAQQRFLDLTLSKMETAEAKISYLKQVLGWKGSPSVPDAIRAHAGVECAKLLFDRGEDQTARNVLAEAVRLCPACVEGQRLRYQTLPANASNFERAEYLMRIVEANPNQPGYLGLLADQIAGLGLVDESLPWYQTAVTLGVREGHPDLDLALRTASEMFIAGQANDAATLTGELAKARPDNPLVWFLKLSISHSSPNRDQFTKDLGEARNAMSNRLVDVVNKLSPGNPQATTRPIDADGMYTLPDMTAAIAEANKGNPLKNDLVTALFHLSTLEIYFAQLPSSAENPISALKQLLPADDADLTRLLAWDDLMLGKTGDAKTKFMTIAARDPLAQLGLVKLASADPGDHQAAQSMGRKLITDYPSGVVGAILWDGMHDLKISIVPTKEAEALKQELAAFPKDWLKIVDQPQNFYSIHAEPVQVGRGFGDPMLARLKIQNLGNQDITIGEDGIIKRNLWFNAEVKGFANQQFVGTAFDEIAGPIVLHGRSALSQVIRLDQGALKAHLASNPIVAMQVTGSAMTNPGSAPNGQLMSTPGGYTVRFTKPFSRTSSPMGGAGPQAVLKDLTAGKPEEKMSAINLLSAYAMIIRAQKDAPDALKQAGANISDAIDKSRQDPNPSVSAWAGFASLSLADIPGRTQIVRDLVADPDWRHRLVGLAMLGSTPDAQHDVLQQLATDPEPSIRHLAAAWNEYIDIASKLPPSTEPAATPAATP